MSRTAASRALVTHRGGLTALRAEHDAVVGPGGAAAGALPEVVAALDTTSSVDRRAGLRLMSAYGMGEMAVPVGAWIAPVMEPTGKWQRCEPSLPFIPYGG